MNVQNMLLMFHMHSLVCSWIVQLVLGTALMLELHAHLCLYIVMYGLRLFIVVLQELHCLPNCLHVCMIRVRCYYHFTKFRCSTLSGSEITKCIA